MGPKLKLLLSSWKSSTKRTKPNTILSGQNNALRHDTKIYIQIYENKVEGNLEACRRRLKSEVIRRGLSGSNWFGFVLFQIKIIMVHVEFSDESLNLLFVKKETGVPPVI